MGLLESCDRGRYIATMSFLWVFEDGLSKRRLLCCLPLLGSCAWPHELAYAVVLARAPPSTLADVAIHQGCGQVEVVATLDLLGSCAWPSWVGARIDA